MVEQNETPESEPIDLFVRPPAAKRVNRVFLSLLLAGIGVLVLLTQQVSIFGSEDADDDSVNQTALPMNLDRLPDSYAQLQDPKPEPPEPKPEPLIVEPKPEVKPTVKIGSPQRTKKPDHYDEAFKAGFFWQDEPGSKRQLVATAGAETGDAQTGLQDRLRNLNDVRNTRAAASDEPIQDVTPHHSDWTLYEGSVISAVLLTGVNSEQPGMVVARTLEPVFDSVRGDNLIIPQGTRVIGQHGSDVETGKRRLSVVWHRLIFPDGRSIQIGDMPGTDHHGVSGITGKVNNHWGRILSAAILSSLLNIGATIPDQYIVEEFGQGINRSAQEVIRRDLRILPTVTIPGGTRINLMTNRDIDLKK